MELVNIIYAGQGKIAQDYSLKDKSLIPSNYINSTFGDTNDRVELYLYDLNDNLIDTVYDFKDYTPYQVINPETGKFDRLLIDPANDAKSRGFDRGSFNVQYNFFKNLFNSNDQQRYWIKEISPSRTEIKLSSQVITDDAIRNGFNQYQAYIALKNYYSDFYLNFGNNEQIIAINSAITSDDSGTYLLIKLYEPLPFDYDVKTQLWIVDKIAESVSYNVEIEVEASETSTQNSLRGPNFSIRINEKNTQTTPYYSYNSLLSSPITSSYRQLASYYQDKAISINVDYSNFENFVHFSSATERLNNFVYKINLVENYSAQIVAQSTIIGSGNQTAISSSITTLQNSISNIIENFDTYEYYLYYASESFAWPKSNTTKPYLLYSVTSSQVSNWLGSETTVPNQFTASLLYSASLYDDTNKDLLRGSIPQYLIDDSNNAPYVTFVDMIAQHFDNIWIYYKDVTNRFNATNDPFTGISLDMVSDALKSMGMELYTNTSVSNNVYYDLFGYNEDGTLLPPTGSEVIKTYVTSSLPTGSMGSKQIQQEIYKRIYHNLPYLLKSRGTQRAVKALISIYGIPNNILTVNEFGGYNRYNIDGVNEINNNKITGVTSSLYLSSSLLSPYTTLQYYQNDNRLNSTNVEVGFSIADILNSNITSSLGYFNIDNLIGNPNDQYSSSYSPLVSASNAYFASYTQPHSVWEYIRLIKYFNNSLFKTIKDFVPARANVSTGIIVKSHILERNKYARHEPSASIDNISQSIDMLTVSGEPGNIISGSTEWSIDRVTPVGLVPFTSSQGVEKLTGEFGGTTITATNGDALSQSENSNGTVGSIGPVSVNLGALYQNVTGSVRSVKYLDLDYTSNQLTPINLGLITQSIDNSVNDNYNTYTNPNNPYAQLQDYNYATRHFTDPRYYGSNTTSYTYNTYTRGDSSYGKTAAIDKIKYQYAYLVDIYSASRYLPNRSNAQIKYLIDNNQNVLDLTKVNTNIFDVQNVYKSGETVDISLFKYDEKNPYSQQLANNPTLQIYEGGFRYLPILHNISGSPSNTQSQSFSLIIPEESTVLGGGGGTSPSEDPYLQASNWNVYWWSAEDEVEPGFPGTSDYRFYVSASYVGPSAPPTTFKITISMTTAFNPVAGDCTEYGSVIDILVPIGQTQAVSPLYGSIIGATSTGNGDGGSVFGGSWWPPFSVPNCPITITSVAQFGSGGGGGTPAFSYTDYITSVTASQNCIYYRSESNELVFDHVFANHQNNIVFNSTSDNYFVGSGLDTVITPFTLQKGDRISFYNSQALGWDERFEYVIQDNAYVTSSSPSPTGSRLLVKLSEPVNAALLSSGSTIPLDEVTGAPYRACRYIIWKHVPDETNVMLRYNPKDSTIVEEGLLFPQYISEQDKLDSGNTVKSLRSQNLLPPQ
jgi:hypothetical protein